MSSSLLLCSSLLFFSIELTFLSNYFTGDVFLSILNSCFHNFRSKYWFNNLHSFLRVRIWSLSALCLKTSFTANFSHMETKCVSIHFTTPLRSCSESVVLIRTCTATSFKTCTNPAVPIAWNQMTPFFQPNTVTVSLVRQVSDLTLATLTCSLASTRPTSEQAACSQRPTRPCSLAFQVAFPLCLEKRWKNMKSFNWS